MGGTAGKPPSVPKLSFGSAIKDPEMRPGGATTGTGGGGGAPPPKMTPLKLNLMGQGQSSGSQQQRAAGSPSPAPAQGSYPSGASPAANGYGGHGGSPSAYAADSASLTPEEFLDREKTVRRIYSDEELHVSMLTLLLQLLTADANGDAMEKLYCDQLPLERGKPNVPFFLGCHLSHPQNAPLLPALVARAHEANAGAARLLRLLVPALFDAAPLAKRERMARGAFASVFRVQLPPLGDSARSAGPAGGLSAARGHVVALKAVDAPASIHDPCAPHELFHEARAHIRIYPRISRRNI